MACPAFNLDILMPFVEETIKHRDCILEDTSDLSYYVLDYIYDDYISYDVICTIAYNDIVDKIDYDTDEIKLYNKVTNYLDWSESYENNINGFLEKYKGDKLN